MVIANSTSLIHLSRAGYLGLLQRCFTQMEIPRAVYQEALVKRKEKKRTDALIVEQAINEGWITIVDLDEPSSRTAETILRTERIGAGEAQATALASKRRAPLVTDDKVVHRLATMYGVKTLWTTTIILHAVSTHLLRKDEGKQILRELIRTGYRLKTEVYDALIKRIDEL